MPYGVKKKGSLWITYNKETGQVKGKHATKKKAVAQMRLLYMKASERGETFKRKKARKK